MSSSYYRVTPEPEKVEGYGFRRVSQSELCGILSRVTKATYSSRIQRDEGDKIHNYRRIRSAAPPRTPSSCHRLRIASGPQATRFENDQKLPEAELQRLLRRVRRPTHASTYSQKYYESAEEDEVYLPHDRISRSTKVTLSEQKKAFDQLSRPTTASQAKDVTDCHLCDPREKENNNKLVPFEYPYADDTASATNKEEVASIVSRVSSPTKASQKGVEPCWKTPPNLEEVRHMDERLPLVSGLARSRSVAAIVDRLHGTKGNYRHRRKFHGYDVIETPVTNFYTQQNTSQCR